MSGRAWTEAEYRILRESYADRSTSEIADQLCRSESSVYQQARKLGLEKSLEAKARTRFSGNEGHAHRFSKGNQPWNKGKKGWQAGGDAEKTKFKPGNRPQTWKPVGTVRVNKDGIIEIKVSDTRQKSDWQGLHRIIWEKNHGPIPEGHIVVFRDGNRRNFADENLESIDRAENVRRNSIHRYPRELKQVMRLSKRLQREIAEHEKPN